MLPLQTHARTQTHTNVHICQIHPHRSIRTIKEECPPCKHTHELKHTANIHIYQIHPHRSMRTIEEEGALCTRRKRAHEQMIHEFLHDLSSTMQWYTLLHVMQHTATLCSILQRAARELTNKPFIDFFTNFSRRCNGRLLYVYCDTLQHTAVHCNVPQEGSRTNHSYISPRIFLDGTLVHIHVHTCNPLRHTATHCSTL